MALVRWRNRAGLRPWNPLGELEGHMDRLFSDFAGDLSWHGGEWMPAIDVKESDNTYTLEADLPGVKKEDVELTIVDNVVTIKGERKREEQVEENGYHRVERSHGSFQRSFTFPEGFDGGNVKAHYENGVLRVTLPKREEAKPKRIEVKVK